MNKLSYISRILSDSLPAYIWNNVTNFHFRSFNNLYIKLFPSHKKKFFWLLHRSELNKANKIKTINFNYIMNSNNHKVLKPLQKSSHIQSTNETLIKINIEPSNFLDDMQDSLSKTNNKWFINLSNSYIPTQVTNLVQLVYR